MQNSHSTNSIIEKEEYSLGKIPVELLVHELRTPLNAVIGFTQLALEIAEAKHDDDIATELQTSLRASQHLSQLISDLMNLSKLDSGKVQLNIQSVNLQDLFLDASATLMQQITANENQLMFKGAEQEVHLMTDYMRLMQILINLVSNANNHTQNGLITVSFDPSKNNGAVNDVITVSDTGCGIREESIKTIFEPFAQDDSATIRTQPGTGLGLTITRAICRLLNGDIYVDSTLGKGSTFTVVLPNI